MKVVCMDECCVMDVFFCPECGMRMWLSKTLHRDTKIHVQFPDTLMEPSKILGCKEECSSSASGWTMYIGSPAAENDNCEDDDDDSGTYKQKVASNNDDRPGDDDDDDKSDDSMASDASSGPSNQELPLDSCKPSLDKHATGKYSSKQKLHKQKTKRDESRIKVERDEQHVLKAKIAASQTRSGAKVRKPK